MISSVRSHCDESFAVRRVSISTRDRRKVKGAKLLHVRVIFYCTFGSLIFYLIFCLNGAMILMSQADIGWLPFAYCRFAKTVASLSYGIAKACMYGVLIARLFVGFHGSAYAISKRVIFGYYAILCLAMAIFATVSVLFYRGEAEKHGCETKAPVLLFVAGSTFDLIFTVTVVYTFVSSLNKMLIGFTKHMDESTRAEDKESNVEVYLLPLKYSTLSTVATVSTMCAAVLFAFAGAYFLIALDCVLNSAALVLMTGKWMPAFVLLCTPLLKCMAHTPCLPCASISEAELIEMASDQQKIAKRHKSLASDTDFSL